MCVQFCLFHFSMRSNRAQEHAVSQHTHASPGVPKSGWFALSMCCLKKQFSTTYVGDVYTQMHLLWVSLHPYLAALPRHCHLRVHF